MENNRRREEKGRKKWVEFYLRMEINPTTTHLAKYNINFFPFKINNKCTSKDNSF
jgi:hypothetical protein